MTNPAPKWPTLIEQGHNHLVRSVQPEGECEACDRLIWQPQRERLEADARRRPGPRSGRWSA